MKIIPCNDNVLIKKKVEKSSAWLAMPNQIDYCEWEVISVGPWAINLKTWEYIPMGVKVWQNILVKDYMIDKLKAPFENYIMLPMVHILWIIENDD